MSPSIVKKAVLLRSLLSHSNLSEKSRSLSSLLTSAVGSDIMISPLAISFKVWVTKDITWCKENQRHNT